MKEAIWEEFLTYFWPLFCLSHVPAVFGMRNTIEDITMNEIAEAMTRIDMMKVGIMTTAVAMTNIAKLMKRDQTSEVW
jgi:hypothetical protein